MQIPEDKVVGRLNALRQAQERKNYYLAEEAKHQAEEEKEMLEKGYTKTEINCLRHANRIARLEAMGYGVSHRVKRITVPA